MYKLTHTHKFTLFDLSKTRFFHLFLSVCCCFYHFKRGNFELIFQFSDFKNEKLPVRSLMPFLVLISLFFRNFFSPSRSSFIFIHISMKLVWAFILPLCWVLNRLLKSGNAGPSVLEKIFVFFDKRLPFIFSILNFFCWAS